MRTHSYCLGCKYSLQMYLRSSSSSSTTERGCNSVLLATCAEDKQSSQSKLPVTADILRAVCVSYVSPLVDRGMQTAAEDAALWRGTNNALHGARHRDADISSGFMRGHRVTQHHRGQGARRHAPRTLPISEEWVET